MGKRAFFWGLSLLFVPISAVLAAPKVLQNWTREERVALVQDFCRDLKSSYALWEIKKITQQIDGEKICARAIREEAKISDLSIDASHFKTAEHSLEFIDRFLFLIAQFKDSHLSLDGPARGYVALPFAIQEITEDSQKKFIISVVYPDTAEITPGSEVLSIDGLPVETALQNLLPYIPNSSPADARREAIDALTRRNFRYPRSSFLEISLRPNNNVSTSLKTVQLSWMVTHYRSEALRFFSAEVGYHHDGYADYIDARDKPAAHPFHFLNQTVCLDNDPEEAAALDEDKTILKAGPIFYQKKLYYYLALSALSGQKVTCTLPDGTAWKGTHAQMVAKLSEQWRELNVPVILDLRDNPGGFLDNALAWVSFFPSQHPKNFIQTTYRISPRLISIINESISDGTYEDVTDFLTRRRSFGFLNQLLGDAKKLNQPYTQIFNEDLTAVSANELFSSPLVLLGSACTSACEIAAQLLKESGRALLIGQPTNGTGAGFSFDKKNQTAWRPNLPFFSVEVPNFIFGSSAFGEMDAQGIPKFSSENRPTVPNMFYTVTREDVLQRSAPLFRFAISEYEKFLETP